MVVPSGNSKEGTEGKVGESGGVGGESRSKVLLPEKFESLIKRALRAFAPILLLLGSADEVLELDTALWKNREREPREIEALEKESILLVEIR